MNIEIMDEQSIIKRKKVEFSQVILVLSLLLNGYLIYTISNLIK